MIRNFIKLAAQKLLFPVSLQAMEIYHSSGSILSIIDSAYTLYYIVVSLSICLIKVGLDAGWLTLSNKDNLRNIKWMGYLMFLLGVIANVNAYYDSHLDESRNFIYWCGYFYIVVLLAAFEMLSHLLFEIKKGGTAVE